MRSVDASEVPKTSCDEACAKGFSRGIVSLLPWSRLSTVRTGRASIRPAAEGGGEEVVEENSVLKLIVCEKEEGSVVLFLFFFLSFVVIVFFFFFFF